jgi:hypothetical protein
MLTAAMLALTLAAAEPAAAAGVAPASKPEVPAGVPADDYGLVAWCQGALTGHMELRELVKDELEAVSPGDPVKDENMRQAGLKYLDLYARAMRAAEQASITPIQNRGRAASSQGYALWSRARTFDSRNRMWAYLFWDLPGSCETAAKRLEERSSLMGEALRRGSPAPNPPATSETGRDIPQ